MDIPPPVKFLTTRDGYDIAYSSCGSGQPVVFLPLGLNHIQLAWTQDGRVAGWLRELGSRFRLIQFDERGQGMSQRGLDASYSMADWETDLELVLDVLSLEDVVLLGYFSSGHVALRYAARCPERVKAVVLVSCSLSNTAWPLEGLLPIARNSWDGMLHNWVPPTATPDERARYLALFKETRTSEDWRIWADVWRDSSIEDVASSVQTPTLIMHPRDFLWLPSEESSKLAARIPGARFLLIDGNLPMGDALQGVDAIETFLAGLSDVESQSFAAPSSQAKPVAVGLSSRQAEVLRLIAEGKTTREIADILVLSERTVERHVADVYAKIGARNRAEATAYALRQPAQAAELLR